ncbi:hypothetical protein R1sor_006983 [Riccia sorocarpa]|uniref:Calcineurin-like phosphoesterase domain-containing protein n=1 Tax=Riccia sorocarpa TaxID=122646 RepID=A0ABD3HP43_9MARC
MVTAGETTICIGDIHGYLDKLKSLWQNLEARLPTDVFNSCNVIFLGDYNDRGPDTRGVLDFLISLPSLYPNQKHAFLCGNHDFAFMGCLGVLPPTPPGFSYSSTWEKYLQNQEREGWWTGDGQNDVHVQARRWAGHMKTKLNMAKGGVPYMGSTFDAAPTFESYGVAHGDRAGLIAAVPEQHKEFLRNLAWVHEQEGVETGDPETSYSKLIAVHAGFESNGPIEAQIQPLLQKDSTIPRLEQLYGRKNVWNNPKQLADERVLLVSGHHGALHIDKFRLIIDESGGLADKPIAAVILPSRIIVRDTDDQSQINAADSALASEVIRRIMSNAKGIK